MITQTDLDALKYLNQHHVIIAQTASFALKRLQRGLQPDVVEATAIAIVEASDPTDTARLVALANAWQQLTRHPAKTDVK